jgi:hypothetical protein
MHPASLTADGIGGRSRTVQPTSAAALSAHMPIREDGERLADPAYTRAMSGDRLEQAGFEMPLTPIATLL